MVTGSGAGSRDDPRWFRNLRHTDRAVIEVGPSFAKYQVKVEREIPMAVLTPVPSPTL